MDLPIDHIGEDMPAGPLQALARHWLDLYRRAGGRVPTLRAVDPLQFGCALADAWIIDAAEDGRFYFRLCGETLAEWYGFNPRGRAFEDVLNPQALPVATAQTRAVLSRPMAVYQRQFARIADRSEPAGFSRIGLPLAGDDGRIRHMLGATHFHRPVLNGRGSIGVEPDFECVYAIPAAA
jgi:hypothetical protein